MRHSILACIREGRRRFNGLIIGCGRGVERGEIEGDMG